MRPQRIGDPGPMGRLLVRGEPGNQILDELAPLPGEIVIDKPGKGAFYATGLGEMLAERGITHLVFAGVTTEVCVQTTMREANDRGYECLLIEDATESYFPEFKTATLAMITRARRDRRLGDAACDVEEGSRPVSDTPKKYAPDPEAIIDAMAPLLGIDRDAGIQARRNRESRNNDPARSRGAGCAAG